MSRAFFFAHFTAWAIIWGHVLVYYGMFAYREWRAAGGLWTALPAELSSLFCFTFGPLLGDCRAVIGRRPLSNDSVESRYAKAHRMSFFISMAALTYALMGLSYSVWPDRSQWPLLNQIVSVLLISTTSIAGLGHLFTALEHSPRKWRWFIVAILAWYPVSMTAFNLVAL